MSKMIIEIKATDKNDIEISCKGMSIDVIPALANIATQCMRISHEILCKTDDSEIADKIMRRTMEEAYRRAHEDVKK